MSEAEPGTEIQDDDPDQSEGADSPDVAAPSEGEEAVTPDAPSEPSEDEAEAAAEAERVQELAAAQQEEAASIEKQQREQDQQVKKLNQVAGHTLKRYKEILGDDLGGWVPCEMCVAGLPGIRLPVMPEPEVIAAIKRAIGEDPDPPLNSDNYSRQCDTCGGYGKVKTGSHVTGQGAAQCLDCHGRGWIAVGSERDSNGHAAEPVPAVASFPVAPDFPPPPLATDEPRTPEEDRLRQLGAIVVWPPKPPDPSTLIGG